MIYIGIDPGTSGAIAAITQADVILASFSPDAYRDILYDAAGDSVVACLELVHAMPGQGVRSTFSFGENFGFIRGILEAYHIPYQLTPPQKWKREFSIGADKSAAIQVCRRLFPDVDLRKPGGRRPNDGIAEALLMAEYARRNF